MMRIGALIAAACVPAALVSITDAAITSPLLSRGYTALPAPQRVTLKGADVEVGPAWRLETAGIPEGGVARSTLIDEITNRHGMPRPSASGTAIRLVVRPGSVAPGDSLDRNRSAIASQAYSLRIRPREITITANAAQGLFYGVETVAQLLKRAYGKWWLPEGDITDWPDLEIRNLYWDDAHHLDRPAALKEAIRQAAFFKINGFVIKLEGHFQFKHAPAIVEPYALSPAELQDLTNYALRYHVQLIPYLDAPAHIAFILKHPEYAPLRAFPDSNYELCATNSESDRLLQGMFEDLLDANRGVEYIYLSTDEPYYIGWAENAQCNEKAAAERYGSRGKLLAEFVSKIGGYLHERGRKVVFWGEYPLTVGDIPALPAFLINGEVYGPEFDHAYRSHGMRQMIYTSAQGEERVFPNYYSTPSSRELHASRELSPRISDVFDKVSFDQSRKTADLMGMVVAGWGDAGQHPGNFWLGYVAGTAAGWRPGDLSGAEIAAAFYKLFYGPEVTGMDRAYQLLSAQAHFWTDSWDTIESTSRKPIWGNSERIFTPRHPARDQTIPLPNPPDDALRHGPEWSQANARRLQLASEFASDNDELSGILNSNMLRGTANRGNLEVLMSEAMFCRQNLETILDLGRIDKSLSAAASEADQKRPKQAVAALDQAVDLAVSMRDRRNSMLRDVTSTWYKTWFPRVPEANGRKYLHEVDDVKDHLPDRTADMSYLILRQLQLPMDEWAESVLGARNRYAAAHKLPNRVLRLDWTNIQAAQQIVTTAPSLE